MESNVQFAEQAVRVQASDRRSQEHILRPEAEPVFQFIDDKRGMEQRSRVA